LFLATAILSPAKMGPSIRKTSIKKKRYVKWFNYFRGVAVTAADTDRSI
jgi:hypothetical protein